MFRRRSTSSDRALTADPAAPVDLAESSADAELPAIARVSVRRRLPRVQIDGRMLLIVIALIATALFSVALTQGALPRQVLTWWPLAIVAIAAVWFIRALLSQAAAGLLGSTALFGFGVSLLLASAYQVAFGTTVIGVVLIAIGMGIVLRGLLWRPATR